ISKASRDDDCIRFIKPFSESEVMMTISLQNKSVYLPDSANKINKFYGVNFSGTPIKTQKIQINREHKKELFESNSISLEKLIWDASIGASLGRLPHNADYNSSYKLKYWPNLSRYKLQRGFMQIAALWSQNGYSISQVNQ